MLSTFYLNTRVLYCFYREEKRKTDVFLHEYCHELDEEMTVLAETLQLECLDMYKNAGEVDEDSNVKTNTAAELPQVNNCYGNQDQSWEFEGLKLDQIEVSLISPFTFPFPQSPFFSIKLCNVY